MYEYDAQWNESENIPSPNMGLKSTILILRGWEYGYMPCTMKTWMMDSWWAKCCTGNIALFSPLMAALAMLQKWREHQLLIKRGNSIWESCSRAVGTGVSSAPCKGMFQALSVYTQLSDMFIVLMEQSDDGTLPCWVCDDNTLTPWRNSHTMCTTWKCTKGSIKSGLRHNHLSLLVALMRCKKKMQQYIFILFLREVGIKTKS